MPPSDGRCVQSFANQKKPERSAAAAAASHHRRGPLTAGSCCASNDTCNGLTGSAKIPFWGVRKATKPRAPHHFPSSPIIQRSYGVIDEWWRWVYSRVDIKPTRNKTISGRERGLLFVRPVYKASRATLGREKTFTVRGTQLLSEALREHTTTASGSTAANP